MQLRLVAGVLVAALGVHAMIIARAHPVFSVAGSSTAGMVALLVAGLSLLLAGLIFWTRRSGNVIGPLLVAASAGWFLGEWDNPQIGSSLLFTVGLVLTGATPALLAWTVLCFPRGRLDSRLARGMVAAGLVTGVLLLGIGSVLWFGPATNGCADCPSNLLLVADYPTLAAGLQRIAIAAACGWAVAAVLLIGWQWLRATPAQRRIVGPISAAGGAYLGLIAASYAVSVDRGFLGSGAVDERLWLAEAGAMVAVGAAVIVDRIRVTRVRASLIDLVLELGKSLRPGANLHQTLSRLLGDPGLVVVYPLADGRYADADGRLLTIPPADGRTITPLVRDDRTVALLVSRPGLLGSAELVEEVASAACLVLDHERLRAEVKTRTADLTASRARIVEAGDAERQRLERNLHDGAQQRLIVLLLIVRRARTRLADIDPSLCSRLDEIDVELVSALEELRRVAHGIFPAILADEGLAAALDSLSAEAGLLVDTVPAGRFPSPVEHAAYQVVAEFVRHGATTVTAIRGPDSLLLDVGGQLPPGALVELEDRLVAVNASIRADGGPGGVQLRATIPCG
jgi:signal transduction histidine kinase